jgi:hypothetical protein
MGFPDSLANFSSSVGSMRHSPVSTLETKDCYFLSAHLIESACQAAAE